MSAFCEGDSKLVKFYAASREALNKTNPLSKESSAGLS